MRRALRRALLPTLSLLWAGAAGTVPAQQTPEDMGIEERVRIDYVLIDFIVLDEQDRPVSDITLGELRLKVGGHKVEIETLDRHCEGLEGAAPPPPESATAPPPATAAEPPPRLVLVFDYDHMNNSAEVFDRAQELMAERAKGGEQHMLVSFGEVVRLETPFTSDLDELRWALRRMRNDRDLFARYRARLSEEDFFDRVRALFELLGPWPGRKTVVLFSGPFMRDGFTYDERYRDLAALAGATRTAVYPVDTAGLRTADTSVDSRRRRRVDPRDTAIGGPPELRRLANETGGSMTADTNDIGLAYDQARRDLACTYTLGFRDPRLVPDRDWNLSLKIVGREGLRVIYPDRYVVRSEEARRDSLFRTAGLAPHVFESSEIRGELFVVGARGGDWKGLIGAELRLPAGAVASAGESWQLEAFLRRPNGTVVHRFTRAVAMPPPEPGRPVVASTFAPLEAPPGDYALSVVLADPRGQPRASTRPIQIPELPQRGPFLLGPILGHRALDSFRPLMQLVAQAGAPLDALTVFCMTGPAGAAELPARVTRRIVDPAEREIARLADATTVLAGDGVRCHDVLDKIETQSLAPGSYEIRARGEAGEWITEESGTEFTIEAKAP